MVIPAYSYNKGECFFVNIVVSLLIVYTISFLLIFRFIFSKNRKESEGEKISNLMVVFLSAAFSFIITAFIGLVIFALVGSTSIVNFIFSLDISMNQLVILAISFLIYLVTLDDLVEFALKYIVGRQTYYEIILVLIRIIIFYIIGYVVGLNETESIIIAVGVSLISIVLKALFQMRTRMKNEQKD